MTTRRKSPDRRCRRRGNTRRAGRMLVRSGQAPPTTDAASAVTVERSRTCSAARRSPRAYGGLLASCLLVSPCLGLCAAAPSETTGGESGPETTVEATAFYYAMPDQSDFASGVASYNRGSLHVEARYNYEDRDAASAFIGWNFAGGGDLSFEVTPIAGLLFGSTRGVVPGLEASVAYGSLDASVEAEYVHDLDQHDASYFYTWNELGWSPRQWLRVGLAGQHTRTVDSSRELDRGCFAQLSGAKLHFGIYVFNPDLGSRYVVASFGASF